MGLTSEESQHLREGLGEGGGGVVRVGRTMRVGCHRRGARQTRKGAIGSGHLVILMGEGVESEE